MRESKEQLADLEIVREHLEAERGSCSPSEAVRYAVRQCVSAIKRGSPVPSFASGTVAELSESEARSILSTDALIAREGAYGWPEASRLRTAWDSMVEQAKCSLVGATTAA